MIGFRIEIRALGAPPKVLVKKSRSLWLLFCGFGFVLGAPVLIDQATSLPRTGTTKGFAAPVIEVWKPVVLPDRLAGRRARRRRGRGRAQHHHPRRTDGLAGREDGGENRREHGDGEVRGRACVGARMRELAGPWTSLNTPFRGGLRGFLASAPGTRLIRAVRVAGSWKRDPPSSAIWTRRLESFGIEADETERAVMAGVWSIWEPGMNLLRDADLDGVEHEIRPGPLRPAARMTALDLPLREQAAGIASGEIDAGELLDACLDQDRGAKPGAERDRRDLPGRVPRDARGGARRAAARGAGGDQGRVATALAGRDGRRGRRARRHHEAGRVRPLPRPARRGRGDSGGRQHARARLEQHRQHLGLRGGAQPLGSRALSRRLLERPRRRGRGRPRLGRGSARTDSARSATRPPIAASPVSSRPSAAPRWRATTSPTPRRSSRARSAATPRTAACSPPRCSARSFPHRTRPAFASASSGTRTGATPPRASREACESALEALRGGGRRRADRGRDPRAGADPSRRRSRRAGGGGRAPDARQPELTPGGAQRDQPRRPQAAWPDPGEPRRPRVRRPRPGAPEPGRALRADRRARLADGPGGRSSAHRPDDRVALRVRLCRRRQRPPGRASRI